MRFFRLVRINVLILGLMFILAADSTAADHSFTLSYLPVKGTKYVEVSEEFAERIKTVTNGKVEIILNDSLFKGTQLAQAVRDNMVALSAILAGYYSATNPQFGLAQLPGLINNLEEFKKVFYGFWRDDLNQVLDQQYNAHVLVWGLFCPQNLISITPIKTVQDFMGKKIRVHNIETGTLVNTLGAKPVPMDASEVLPALQRGIIDGVFTDSCWAYGQAFYSEAKFVSLWPISTILPFPIVINKDEWNKLPKNLQDIISQESSKIEQSSFESYTYIIENFSKNWDSKGAEYYEAPKEEIEKLFQQKNIDAVYKAFFERAKNAGFDGKAYVEQAEKFLGKKITL